MNNVSKSAVAPIVSTLLMAVGLVTHKVFSSDTVNEVTDITVAVIGGAVTIWGIIKNHKKDVVVVAPVAPPVTPTVTPTDNQTGGTPK
jgi:hypothetical protein